MINPESRDYNISDIKVDPRFKQINKEALLSFLVFCAHGLFLLINVVNGAQAYTPDMPTIMGLPSWLAIQLIEFLVYIVVIFLLVDKVYKNMDVTPRGKIHE